MPKHAQAATTFTVTSTTDDVDSPDNNPGDGVCASDNVGNPCTLRAAIEEANALAGADTIEFNIAPLDGNVKTIAPSSQLPDITDQVTIDGYTQDPTVSEPNSAVAPAPFNGVLLVELSGEDAVGTSAGLNMVDGSDGSVIKGLVINRFSAAGIVINPGADAVKVKANYIGTDPTGLLDRGNVGSGVTTTGSLHGTEGPDNVVIGGTLAADRNIISANSTHSNDPNMVIGSQGIAITGGSDDWVVQGNYIGVGANGTTDLGNELGGMTIDYIDGLLIGGDTPGAGNVVSGNGDGGLQPDGVLNLVIQGNYIGTDYTGSAPLPNGTKGITLAYGTQNALVGGTTAGAGNIIAYNPWFGINVWQEETQNVTIIGNSIHDNGDAPGYGGNVGLGIDLSNQSTEGGLSVNDNLDTDTGANSLLNYPEYSSVSENAGNTTVDYRLDAPAGSYRIEFFSNTVADPSGHGEGETYLGFQNIIHGGGGKEYFTHVLTGVTGVTNLAVTATQRDNSADGFGATSEFGGQYTPVADLSATKTLLNPEDVARGAVVSYDVSIINNGPDKLDLTQFASVGTGPPIFVDFAPPDLSAANRLSVGPLPDSYIIDVGNPDVTCLWAGPNSGGLYAGLIINASYSVTYCWYTGALIELYRGDSITSTLSFTVANDSSLNFTNYALAGNTETDPENSAIGSIFGAGGDVLSLFISTNGTINNFASAVYPVPVTPTQTAQPNASNNGALGTTGQIVYSWQMLAVFSISTALLIHKWRTTKTNTYKIAR